MKFSQLVGERFKERPADCVIDSQALMTRGGYMKYVANGIFSQYTPLRRVCRKIETILREEMERIGGQEVLFPVALPGSLWMESGRYDSVGKELLRFQDRAGAPMVLGMTHEEAAVQLVREYAQSYTRYPIMIYQLQTKFRDEARPRGGLIRVREFTMKDAYSFHTSQEDLEQYYNVCLKAYQRIFARVGLPEVVAVASDSGMMGGNLSHEFMLLTPVGEDTIVQCPQCGSCWNMEAAENIVENIDLHPAQPLSLVHTPNAHTIEDVCQFLHVPLDKSCKAVVYQTQKDKLLVIVFIRGDLEINETKLTNYLQDEVAPAEITPECGLKAGYIGPYRLKVNGAYKVLFDRSLKETKNLCCGANQEGFHYTGLDIQRDCGDKAAVYLDLAKVKEGGICPCCGKHSLTISRGIEVGNIFQLGTKYTKAMGMQYLDQEGKSQFPLMGCYGIGVERLAASICELRHDMYGPVWPISVSPWEVHLCCIRSDNQAAKAAADQIYQQLEGLGLEVLYDDRNVRAGVMFSDADLIGIPIRIIVSPRNQSEGNCEITLRDKSKTEMIPLGEVASIAVQWVKKMKEQLYK